MRLYEIVSIAGTYAKVVFAPETINSIRNYIKKNNIPNPISTTDLHTTLLYSRKHLPNYTAVGIYKTPMVGIPTQLHVWKTRPEDGSSPKNCLVLEYSCPALQQRHALLRKVHGATHDFPTYKCHITLSYDIGNLDVDNLSDVKEDIKQIKIIKEISKPLDLNWVQKKSKTT